MRQNRIFPGHFGRGRLGEVRRVTDLPCASLCELCVLAQHRGIKATGLGFPEARPLPPQPCPAYTRPLQIYKCSLLLSALERSGALSQNASLDSCILHTVISLSSPSIPHIARSRNCVCRRVASPIQIARPCGRSPLMFFGWELPERWLPSRELEGTQRCASFLAPPRAHHFIHPCINPAPLPAGAGRSAPSFGCARGGQAAERPGERGRCAELSGCPRSPRLGNWAVGEAARTGLYRSPRWSFQTLSASLATLRRPSGGGGVTGAGARRGEARRRRP